MQNIGDGNYVEEAESYEGWISSLISLNTECYEKQQEVEMKRKELDSIKNENIELQKLLHMCHVELLEAQNEKLVDELNEIVQLEQNMEENFGKILEEQAYQLKEAHETIEKLEADNTMLEAHLKSAGINIEECPSQFEVKAPRPNISRSFNSEVFNQHFFLSGPDEFLMFGLVTLMVLPESLKALFKKIF